MMNGSIPDDHLCAEKQSGLRDFVQGLGDRKWTLPLFGWKGNTIRLKSLNKGSSSRNANCISNKMENAGLLNVELLAKRYQEKN